MNFLRKYLVKQSFALSLLLLSTVCVSAQSFKAAAQNFQTASFAAAPLPNYLANPIKLNPAADCSLKNLRQSAFGGDYKENDRVKLCDLIDLVRLKLWRLRGKVSELDSQVNEIWEIAPYLYFEKISWSEKYFGAVDGAARYDQFYNTKMERVRKGTISLRLNEQSFVYTFLHEARHIKDLYDRINGKASYSSRQLEERGFLIESYYTESSGERFAFFKEFWRAKWQTMPRNERKERALDSINGYLRSHYKELFRSPETAIARIGIRP